jgi:hypothetical protein
LRRVSSSSPHGPTSGDGANTSALGSAVNLSIPRGDDEKDSFLSISSEDAHTRSRALLPNCEGNKVSSRVATNFDQSKSLALQLLVYCDRAFAPPHVLQPQDEYRGRGERIDDVGNQQETETVAAHISACTGTTQQDEEGVETWVLQQGTIAKMEGTCSTDPIAAVLPPPPYTAGALSQQQYRYEDRSIPASRPRRVSFADEVAMVVAAPLVSHDDYQSSLPVSKDQETAELLAMTHHTVATTRGIGDILVSVGSSSSPLSYSGRGYDAYPSGPPSKSRTTPPAVYDKLAVTFPKVAIVSTKEDNGWEGLKVTCRGSDEKQTAPFHSIVPDEGDSPTLNKDTEDSRKKNASEFLPLQPPCKKHRRKTNGGNDDVNRAFAGMDEEPRRCRVARIKNDDVLPPEHDLSASNSRTGKSQCGSPLVSPSCALTSTNATCSVDSVSQSLVSTVEPCLSSREPSCHCTSNTVGMTSTDESNSCSSTDEADDERDASSLSSSDDNQNPECLDSSASSFSFLSKRKAALTSCYTAPFATSSSSSSERSTNASSISPGGSAIMHTVSLASLEEEAPTILLSMPHHHNRLHGTI